MNVNLLSVCFCALAGAALAEVPEWENPAVNSENRLPPRTYAMPLASEKAALTDALEYETPYVRSLNGAWKFSWAGNPDLRAKDFWKADFDDADWFTIDVPSCVERRGFGTPGYTNVRYPHANTSQPSHPNFAHILNRDTNKPEYNPVSSYRRAFTVPADWKGRDVILRFDGVYSAYYVWVNGKRVGYAEDSKLPSEFDITPYLKADPAAENLLAVEVYRWCDGSFLEDQDMNRFSGIFRDVTLWAKPKDGLWDFAVKTTPVEGYGKWRLEVEAASGCSVALYDAAFKKVADLQPSSTSNLQPSTFNPQPSTFDLTFAARLWSAEDPYLYTLVIRKGADIRAKRVGFKEQKIVGNTMLVNGRQIKFKGVNRHETSPENGRTVSLEEMRRDVVLMKRYNFNTVRTSHYPDHRLWYDLCDRYGLYVVAEANVEGHEPGYEKDGLGLIPEWEHTIVERNERHVLTYRNHPCVTFWSMGNETGHGDGFRHAIAAVKRIDPSRPVHWERGNADADVDSTMYPTVEWCEKRGKLGDRKAGAKLESAAGGEGFAISGHTAGKAFFLCEYAHAMGNAIGNFQEYWDVFYRYDCMLGGCIWDWVDQALWKDDGRGGRFYAYGGDWDEEPHDGPFNCNGIVPPDRRVTAKLLEVAHVQRNLVVRRREDGTYELENRFGFTPADAFAGRVALVVDGKTVAERDLPVPALAPLSRTTLAVPAFADPPKGEAFLNFAFALKGDTPWAKAGWVVARDQIAVGDAWNFAAAAAPVAADASVKIAETKDAVTVTGRDFAAVFSRAAGTLVSLAYGGREILAEGPQFGCARAFVDNDRWMRDGGQWGKNRQNGGFFSRGLSQLVPHARPIKVADGKVVTTVEHYGAMSAGFTHRATWTFGADGTVRVENLVTPFGVQPPIPRVGLTMKLKPEYEKMAYYGRGPQENYVDRKTGAFLGLWESTVTDQFEFYVRPQDNGMKCDVRWAAFTDKDGFGVRFAASEPLFMKALHYAWEDLEFSRHRPKQDRFRAPLAAREEVCLDLDVRQTGLGGGSCGPAPMGKYRFSPNVPVSWTLTLAPVRK